MSLADRPVRGWRRVPGGDPVLWVLGLAAAAGLLVALLFHGAGFPVVALDLQVLGPQAQQRAAAFLAERSVDTRSLTSSVTFEVDSSARNYIERSAGLATLNDLGRSRPLWYWNVRFFRPLDATEYRVRIATDGRVAGFSRSLPESAPDDRPSLDEARAVAVAAAAELGYPVASWTPISAGSERRPERLDASFTWEEPGFRIGDATWRVTAVVQGDEPGAVSAYLKVPEAWLRAQTEEFNRGVVLVSVGWTLTYALLLVAALLFVRGVQQRVLRWRFTVAALAILGGVGLVAGLNSLPALLAAMPTTQTVAGYLLPAVAASIGLYLPTAAGVVLAGVVGVWLYRRALPWLPSPERYSWLAGLATRGVVRAVIAGYLLSAIWLGYLTALYALGSRWFGFWSPPEVPYRDIMSSAFPLIFQITAGVAAAIGEEFVFRLLAVPLFLLVGLRLAGTRRWARVFAVFVALVLPALIWGSLHATWPQQPFWIRAAEVGLAGIVSGAVLLRYGILATLVNHYVSNAAIVGALFIYSGNAGLQAAAVVGVVLPLLLVVPWLLARRVAFRPVPHEAPLTVDLFVPVLPERRVRRSPGLWGPRRWVLLVLFAGLLVSVAGLLLLPRLETGALLQLRTDAAAARLVARDVLVARGLDPARYTETVSFIDRSQGDDGAYLLREFGVDRTNRLWDSVLSPFLWQVRYTRNLEKDSAWVWITPDGHLGGYFRSLEEGAPGASLPPAQAQLRAEQLLAAEAAAFSDARLVDTSSERRPARLDQRFVFERPAPDLGEARVRASVVLAGAEVIELFPFVKVPETFSRARAEATPTELVWSGFQAVTGLVLAAGGLVAFAGLLRHRRIALRLPLLVGGLYAALWLLQQLLTTPTLLAGYATTMGYAEFVIYRWASSAQAMLLQTGQLMACVALADGLLALAMPRGYGLAQQVSRLFRAPPRWMLVGVILPLPLIALLDRGFAIVRDGPGRDGLVAVPLRALDQLGSGFPALLSLVVAAREALWLTGIATVVVLVAWWFGRRWRPAAPLLIVAAALATGVARFETPGQFAVDAAQVLLFVGIAWFVVRFVAGRSPIAVCYGVFAGLALRDAFFFLTQPSFDFWLTGATIAVVALLPAVWQSLQAIIASTPDHAAADDLVSTAG